VIPVLSFCTNSSYESGGRSVGGTTDYYLNLC